MYCIKDCTIQCAYVTFNGLLSILENRIIFLDEKLRIHTINVFKELKQLNLEISILTGSDSSKWDYIGGIKIDNGLDFNQKDYKINPQTFSSHQEQLN
mgnify:CR=1 FL=1